MGTVEGRKQMRLPCDRSAVPLSSPRAFADIYITAVGEGLTKCRAAGAREPLTHHLPVSLLPLLPPPFLFPSSSFLLFISLFFLSQYVGKERTFYLEANKKMIQNHIKILRNLQNTVTSVCCYLGQL